MDRHNYGSGLPGHGSYGQPLERPGEGSAVLQMKKTYWTVKQTIMKKIGKKEDEHMVASDAELDAKLELFRQIDKSSISLQKVIERYQSRLFILSREENFLGQFLKGQGHEDKTRAGKMMTAVGKSECFSASQRTQLRVPLYRLYQEVDTFRSRAVADTLITVRHMEEARNEYRGALLWMKDASDELDPDAFRQMEKYRKVQGQVKQAKGKFDKYKLDVMQKVDLLAASRSNMFSHALAAYQKALLAFWESTSRLMTAVSDCFVGYQYYEFSMLKELAEPSRKLAEQTSGQQPRAAAQESLGSHQPVAESPVRAAGLITPGQHSGTDDQAAASEVDLLIRDILASVAGDAPQRREPSPRSTQALPAPLPPCGAAGQEQQQQVLLDSTPSLIDLTPKDILPPGGAFTKEDVFGDFQSADAETFQGGEDGDAEQALLLDDVLDGGGPSPGDGLGVNDGAKDSGSRGGSYQDWGAVFSALSDVGRETGSEGDEEFEALLHADSPLRPSAPLSYLPSSLLELGADGASNLPPVPAYSAASSHALLSAVSTAAAGVQPVAMTLLPTLSPVASQGSGLDSLHTPTKEKTKTGDKPGAMGMQPVTAACSRTPKKADLSPWYNLFADLDPLSNPDAVGKKDVDTSDQA